LTRDDAAGRKGRESNAGRGRTKEPVMNLFKIIIVAALAAGVASVAGAQERRQPTRGEARSKVTMRGTTPEPEYRELRCRGSYSMNIKVAEGRSAPPGKQLMNMVVVFEPVSQPTDEWASNLKPGQCAFFNSTPTGAIPSEIHQEIVPYGQLKQRLNGSAVDESPTAAERFPDAQNVPAYLKDSDHYWSFFVRNTGRGYFEASSGRHWKPQRQMSPSDIRKRVRITP
jgi:hypothetical protein